LRALVLALCLIASPVWGQPTPKCIATADTGEALPDWTSLLSAVWYFEESSTPLLDTGEQPDDDDFTWVSSATTQTGTVFEGSRAGQLGSGNYFECLNQACSDIAVADDATQAAWGCRIYRDASSDSQSELLRNYHHSLPTPSGSGWRSTMMASSASQAHEIRCQVDRDSGVGDVTEDTNETVAQDVWTTFDCVVDDTDNDGNIDLHAFQDGALNSSNGEVTGGLDAVPATVDAYIGGTVSNGDLEYMDECYVDLNYEWLAEDVCRRCACGVSGEFCRCDQGTSNYEDCSTNADCGGAPAICSPSGTCQGYHNSAQCDNCTMPDCDKANPG
jgi:hypothetical protein